MIMGLSLATLSAQLERFKLVSVAGMISRALARVEPIDTVNTVFASQLEGRNWRGSNRGLLVCVEVARTVSLVGVADFALRLAEEQCARKLGL
jgi:hypothetical protein